jgi:hypothetical protein
MNRTTGARTRLRPAARGRRAAAASRDPQPLVHHGRRPAPPGQSATELCWSYGDATPNGKAPVRRESLDLPELLLPLGLLLLALVLLWVLLL